jgi:hypothetical protein
MIYEMRTYWAAPGKVEALHNRFRTLTVHIFQRLGMQMVGFWAPQPATPESGSLVYILAFEDKAAMDKAWDIFRADLEWIAGKKASEVDGALVEKISSVLLNPTDYSPLQ